MIYIYILYYYRWATFYQNGSTMGIAFMKIDTNKAGSQWQTKYVHFVQFFITFLYFFIFHFISFFNFFSSTNLSIIFSSSNSIFLFTTTTTGVFGAMKVISVGRYPFAILWNWWGGTFFRSCKRASTPSYLRSNLLERTPQKKSMKRPKGFLRCFFYTFLPHIFFLYN